MYEWYLLPLCVIFYNIIYTFIHILYFCTCGNCGPQVVSNAHFHCRISDYLMLWNNIASCLFDLLLVHAFEADGFKNSSHIQSSALLCLCLLLRSAFNLYCRFKGIHRSGEGHGLTFVYFKGYAQPKCCRFVPCGRRDRDVRPDFCPSTHALWKPSLGRHGNAFSRTHFSDFGAPCLLLPVSHSSFPARWRSLSAQAG